MSGQYQRRKQHRPAALPYPTMTVADIGKLDVAPLAADDAHLWLWSTTSFLPQAFSVMEQWGFKFHTVITWVKPSGFGNYFINRTQPLLFGYRGKLRMRQRWLPNVLFAPSRRHSQKPECSYTLIEQASFDPRLELFARQEREGWTTVGNELDGEDMGAALVKLYEGNISGIIA